MEQKTKILILKEKIKKIVYKVFSTEKLSAGILSKQFNTNKLKNLFWRNGIAILALVKWYVAVRREGIFW